FLDHSRDPRVEVRLFDTQQFLADTVGAGRVQYLSHGEFGLPMVEVQELRRSPIPGRAYPIPTTGLLIQTAHSCFATHQAFGLNPDVIWQTIVNQVAQHIKLNATQYASMFTWFPGQKTEIEVLDNDLLVDNNWLRTLGMFEKQLQFVLGDDIMSLFVPSFSTSTQLDRVASLVALMDAASPYYEYAVRTMCHIPMVRLEGMAEDWKQLHYRTTLLAERFGGLQNYFAALLPVLQEVSETAGGKEPNNDFWSSVYKFQSDSGRENVTGWLTALMAFKHTPQGPVARDDFDWRSQIEKPWMAFKTNEIPSLLSVVPFTWKLQDTEMPMTFVAGALGVSSTDKVYTPKLGIAVMGQ
ncbi:MAG TPA: DUF4419 domain-containing protein, partial [Candidatus Saccharimonadales bacterium]|nr:DUF4419 domain-containing protein [Candidatus Saccharimonadales bacterium]